MTRFFLLSAVLVLAACRTEPTDGTADALPEAATPAMTDSTSGAVEFAEPRREDGAETTTRTATLNDVISGEGDCFIMANDAQGDLLLMGTPEACEQGAGLEGQRVTLTQETATLDVPLGGGTSEQPVELVIGVEAEQ